MGLLDLLGFNKLPAGVAGSSLVLADAATLARTDALLAALQARFGNVAVAQLDGTYSGSLPQIVFSAENATERLKKIRPQRLIVLGLDDTHVSLMQAADCPAWWISAHDVAATQAGIGQLPELVNDPSLCARLKEQRDGGRWVGYFAATGEDEEDIAYALFSRMMRHKMGLMILAPRDRERCEPVYRESIKYRLQTIRHARLSTSFVPIKTRVYYVEDSLPLEGLYACVDFVVAGGTLHPNARNTPDIVSPMLHGKPVIVGSAHRDDPVVAAALAAGVVLAGDDNEQIFAHAQRLIDDPAYRAQLTAQASTWVSAQVGALVRVMATIE